MHRNPSSRYGGIRIQVPSSSVHVLSFVLRETSATVLRLFYGCSYVSPVRSITVATVMLRALDRVRGTYSITVARSVSFFFLFLGG